MICLLGEFSNNKQIPKNVGMLGEILIKTLCNYILSALQHAQYNIEATHLKTVGTAPCLQLCSIHSQQESINV